MSAFSEAAPEPVVAADDLPTDELLEALQARGFIAHRSEPNLHVHHRLDAPERAKVRFAVVSDTHLAHKRQQLTLWRQFVDGPLREWGCDFVLHCGDLVDGGNMHRDQAYELFIHGADAQARYAIENMPEARNRKRQVIPTYVIGGNHDGSFWNSAGANVLGTIADRRDDVTFLGAPVATFHLGSLRIGMVHPDGGVAYARSYRLQKAIEQLPPDEKPHLLLFGHWHIAAHLPGYRNVEAFAVPCFQAQTAFMARKQLAPVIGGLLFEVEYSPAGLESVTTRWELAKAPVKDDWPHG